MLQRISFKSKESKIARSKYQANDDDQQRYAFSSSHLVSFSTRLSVCARCYLIGRQAATAAHYHELRSRIVILHSTLLNVFAQFIVVRRG